MPDTIPEHVLAAERTLLGAILVNNRALLSASFLGPVDFAGSANAKIFAAILGLASRNEEIDLVTVKRELFRNAQTTGVAVDTSYLASLVDGVPRVENVDPWARVIREASHERHLRGLLKKAIDSEDPLEAAQHAEAALADWARAGATQSDTRPISDLVKDAFGTFERLADTSKNGIAGLSTGFRDLDSILAGLKPGELILLAARPAMGKTSLAMQIARGSSARTLVVSLEMSGSAIARRLMATEAQVNQRSIAAGLRESQWNSLASSATELFKAPLWINERALTLGEIRTAARSIDGLELIVIDYLQLMEHEKGENRQQQIAAVSRGLKRLAQDLNVPVLAMSQLSRPSERKDKRPMLTDLRESGALEQDADVVMLIYREETHNPTDANRGRAEIIVAKQREGDTGTVKLNWDKTTTRFFEDPPFEPQQETML